MVSKIFFIFTPNLGKWNPIWFACIFPNGMVQPPTSSSKPSLPMCFIHPLQGVRLLGDVAPELGLVDSSLNRDAVGESELGEFDFSGKVSTGSRYFPREFDEKMIFRENGRWNLGESWHPLGFYFASWWAQGPKVFWGDSTEKGVKYFQPLWNRCITPWKYGLELHL